MPAKSAVLVAMAIASSACSSMSDIVLTKVEELGDRIRTQDREA